MLNHDHRGRSAAAVLLALWTCSSELTAQIPPGMALRGTIVFDDPAQSIALLALQDGQTLNVRVGMEVPGAGRLVSIGTRNLVFEQQGARLAFSFNDSALRTGGALLQGGSSESALARQATAGRPDQLVEARPFRVPAAVRPPVADTSEPSLDATPKPGQIIEETDWDNISRVAAARAAQTPGSPTYAPDRQATGRLRQSTPGSAQQRQGEPGAVDATGAATPWGYQTLADGSQVFVVPNPGRPPQSDASHPWLDATPKPGQTIDTAPRGR